MAFRNQVSALSQLVADRIVGATIEGCTILAGQIVAGAITATELATGAVTEGKVATGAITAAKIAATAIDGKTITGALIRTAAAGKRWELKSVPSNRLLGYSGSSMETAPGYLEVDEPGGNGFPYVVLKSGDISGAGGARIILETQTASDRNIDYMANKHAFGIVGFADPWLLLTSAGLQINGTKTIGGIDFGRANGLTTNASSQVTFNHALGTSPLAISTFPATGHSLRRVTHTATTITVEARHLSTGALVGGGVTVNLDYIALA